MAANLVAEPQRPLEVELTKVPVPPGPGGRRPPGLGRGIDGKEGLIARLSPRSITVRQVPEQAMDAPMSIESGL